MKVRTLSLILATGVAFLGCERGDGHADAHDHLDHVSRDSDDHTEHDDHGEGGGREEPGDRGGHGDHDEVVTLTPEAARRANLGTATAERRALPAVLRSTAQVGLDERRTAHVSPLVAGRVYRVTAELGQQVEEGETLAVLESVELGRAVADYRQAAAVTRRTRATLAREERLLAEQITSEQAVLDARAEHEQAVSALEAAAEALRLLGLGRDEIEAVTSGRRASARVPIVAPLPGRVLERHAAPGEQVGPGDALFTVADLSRVWIWIDVFERDFGRVHPGDAVEVRTRAWPDRTFRGEVTYIRDVVDPGTRTARARIEVDNQDGALKPGMFAEVTVLDPHRESDGPDAVVIPAGALQRTAEGPVAFVREGPRRYRMRHLRLGLRTETFAEILDGVAPGEEVVVEGAFLLKSEVAKESLGGGHSH